MGEVALESIPTFPLFFAMFITIYFTGYFVVFRHWSPKLRPEASSCFISLSHGTPAVLFAAYALLIDAHRGFAAPNTVTQNAVIDFSTAYFVTDLLHYLILFPSDVIFITHHIATLFALLTCRYVVHHGAFAILGLLIIAEVTSFCQNVWTLASVRRGEAATAAKVYELLSPPFYAFYSVVRGFLGPLFGYQMGAFYLSGAASGIIPKWVWVSWMFLVVAIIVVSLLWISNLWVELYRERTRKIEKKMD